MKRLATEHYVIVTKNRVIAGGGSGRFASLTTAANYMRRNGIKGRIVLSLGETSDGLMLMAPGALDDSFLALLGDPKDPAVLHTRAQKVSRRWRAARLGMRKAKESARNVVAITFTRGPLLSTRYQSRPI